MKKYWVRQLILNYELSIFIIFSYLCTAKIVHTMRKILLLVIATLMVTVNIYAQGSLTGRVYHCGNMMAGELNQVKKEVKDISKEAKTNEEKEEVKGMEAIINAIVSTMTLTFIDDKTVEVNSVVKFDEQKAKAGGASWLIRKLVKAKLGKKGVDETKQLPYTINGHTIKVVNAKKKKENIFELSEDGKSMTYVVDKKKVVLKRTK